MITYNHGPFVTQAIEGVLMQKTDYPFELVIGDDCSTDGTIDIIKEYASKHPGTIRLLDHSSNLGMSSNFFRTFKACTGRYVAFCEGDDYWTDSNKLQLQVTSMELSPASVLSYHAVDILNADGTLTQDYLWQKNEKQVSTIYDLVVLGKYIQTCSVMLRHNIEYLPPENFIPFLNDYTLWTWYSQFGDILRLNSKMACYRYGVGIYTSLQTEKQRNWSIRSLRDLQVMLSDPTLIRALELRINDFNYQSLPLELRKRESLADVYSTASLRSSVSIGRLTGAIIKKLARIK